MSFCLTGTKTRPRVLCKEVSITKKPTTSSRGADRPTHGLKCVVVGLIQISQPRNVEIPSKLACNSGQSRMFTEDFDR